MGGECAPPLANKLQATPLRTLGSRDADAREHSSAATHALDELKGCDEAGGVAAVLHDAQQRREAPLQAQNNLHGADLGAVVVEEKEGIA